MTFQKGSKNPMWKGDKVGYKSLHEWVRIRLHIPIKTKLLCEKCGRLKFCELASITGIYNRDLVNWSFLCRSCHMKQDGRMQNLKQFSSRGIQK